MPIHEVAAQGFGSAAGAYEQGRPTYPPPAVDWLTQQLGLGPGRVVCDVGAGTGKLTRLLGASGAHVVAAEPLAGMRAVLADACPDTAVVAAAAEALPFRTASLDAMLAAQAFHWFDTDPSLDEAARALRPGGSVALIWNAWDDDVAWVSAMHQVVADAGSTTEWQRGHYSRAWARDALAAHDGFGDVATARFPHAQMLDRSGVVERVATTSHIVTADVATRDATLAEVREILDHDPATTGREVIPFPYVTEIYASVRA